MKKKIKLSIGIQTFEKLIEKKCVYVDKTKYLIDLIENHEVCFLARPRRFGKSLTISTFDAIFSGKKHLFKGLYAEDFLNSPDFESSPIIRLDMSEITTCKGLDKIEQAMQIDTLNVANKLNVKIQENLSSDKMFGQLIENAAKKYNQKVVILIDEYDKPYTDFVNDIDMANKVRNILRDYYSKLKAKDEYIRFLFITGISKFAKFGVFSTLNTPLDISLMPKYTEICGLTEEEIIKYFPDYLEEIANEMQISTEKLIEEMRKFYNGFCFDSKGNTKLYNPYSTLTFLEKKEFLNHWVDTGRSKMIADYMKNRNLTVEQFRNIPISVDFAQNPGDMDTASPEGFLYQAGYLTLRPGTSDSLCLDYPNTEVLNSMSALVSQNILQDKNDDYTYCRTDLLDALMSIDCNSLVDVFNRLLASIPYEDYEGAAKRSVKNNKYDYSTQEWMYRSVILTFLRGCGVVVFAEMQTNLGRPDLVVAHKGKIWVIEIKVAGEGKNLSKKLEEAIMQIKDNNYAKPYPNAICMGIVIDDAKRQIGEWGVYN